MDPTMAAAMMSSSAGGDSTPVNSSATAISRAGDGAMNFGRGKNQTVLTVVVVGLVALCAFLFFRKK